MYDYRIRVHDLHRTLAKLVIEEEEKKGNPDPILPCGMRLDPIHHTQTVQTPKHNKTRTPGCPALKTGMMD